MKTLVEKWTHSKDYSFHITTGPLNKYKEVVMRVHEEHELSLLIGCKGKRFVGNTIQNFLDGDLFLLGSNLPHSLEIDENEFGERITIHFLLDCFGKGFFELPENRVIAKLLEDSKLGVAIRDVNIKDVFEKMKRLDSLNAFDRMIAFLSLLQELSLKGKRVPLSSPGFTPMINEKDHIIVNKIYQYVMNGFTHKTITLDDISEHVNMAPATFCRYFKKHFSKTFTGFLNEVRVGHACKLLQDTDKNITEICFASGYNQLTHFNRQFKKIIGYSPKQYRQILRG